MKKMFFIVIAAILSCSFYNTSVVAQITITEVSSSNVLGEDWFELTNTGGTTVDLTGFFWDDDPVGTDDGATFGDVLLESGESLIVLEGSELEDSIATTFRDTYDLDASLQILTEDDFTGNDTFSGLSSGGDQISLYDTNPNASGAVFNLIDFVEFSAAPEEGVDSAFGSSFDFTQLDNGVPTLSVSGSNGSVTASNGDVGSPGFADAASQAILLGDINGDGVVNFLDITPFIAIQTTGAFQAEADIDMNGEVNFLDISGFIGILSGS